MAEHKHYSSQVIIDITSVVLAPDMTSRALARELVDLHRPDTTCARDRRRRTGARPIGGP
jgi:hypothetical protein